MTGLLSSVECFLSSTVLDQDQIVLLTTLVKGPARGWRWRWRWGAINIPIVDKISSGASTVHQVLGGSR